MASPTQGKSLLHWLQLQRRRKRRRRGDNDAGPRSLEDVIAAIEPRAFGAQASRAPIDAQDWEAIVGARIANRSSPHRLEPDGTLVVKVTDSVWAQELSLLSSTIQQRLAALNIRIRQLRFFVGKVLPPRRGPTRFERRTVAVPAEIPADLQRELDALDDPELRVLIANVAAATLVTDGGPTLGTTARAKLKKPTT